MKALIKKYENYRSERIKIRIEKNRKNIDLNGKN